MTTFTPGGFVYREAPHPYCGASGERQGVGDPGHCEDCCAVGHLIAHPDYGCGDVMCTRTHGEDCPECPAPLAAHTDRGQCPPVVVPIPRLKKHWTDRRVRTLRELRNMFGIVPAGTVMTVVYNHAGLQLRGDRCGCCGVQVSINKVPESHVQLLPDTRDCPACTEPMQYHTEPGACPPPL